MKIENIGIVNDGYIYCKSVFYFSEDILRDCNHSFSVGINRLTGEIDSGIWGLSYLLSMYPHAKKDFVLFQSDTVNINGIPMSLSQFSQHSCYMDKSYPLFSSMRAVDVLVSKGLKVSKSPQTPEDIRRLFNISDDRFARPLTGVGNEIFKAMAAIGYANGKQVYCFPWLSRMRFESYHRNMTDLLDTLENLSMTVILPLGR